MAKTIPQLTLISLVEDSAQFALDDGVQTYRCTGPQLYAYLKLKYEAVTRTVTTNGTPVTTADVVVYLNPTSASFTQDLPACASMPVGYEVLFKNIATNGNTATLDGNSSELIDNAETLTLDSDPMMGSVRLKNTGTKWLIL